MFFDCSVVGCLRESGNTKNACASDQELSSRPEESWAFGPPKAMKNGSCSATTLNGSAALPFVISTGGVMGLRDTQGDEKRVLFSNPLNGSAALPFVISTGGVMGLRPTQGDEKRVLFSNPLNGSAALPFVMSTGGVMGLRPTQGDEKTGP